MTSRTLARILFGPLLLVLAAAPVRAADKIDLSRVTPVPDTEPVPVMDFFRYPILSNPKLNPAGTRLAAIISPAIDHTELMVYELDTQKIERAGAMTGDYDIYWGDWLSDSRLIYEIGKEKTWGMGLFATNVGSLSNSYPLAFAVAARVIVIPPRDRGHPLVRFAPHTAVTSDFGEAITLKTDNRIDMVGPNRWSEINVRHILGRHPVLSSKDGFDVGYMADKEGHLAYGYSSEDGHIYLNRLAGDHWERCPENLDEIDVLAVGSRPAEIIVVGARQDGKPRPLQVLEAATGRVLDTLYQDPGYDFNGWLLRDPASLEFVGAYTERSAPHSIWFTDAYRNLQKALEKLFPNQVTQIIGMDDQGRRVLVQTYSDRQPVNYSWVDLEKHTANLIKNSAPWIAPARMQPMGMIRYKTADGRTLDAYLTLPAGASKAHPAPLVVLPGAPNDRNRWGFNPEVQFLASRGYAVLQPNHRGSDGYAGLFPESDLWEFRKFHDDVTAATRTLLATGLVDPKRVAIMGTSFGGYLAVAGAAFEPGLYRCAIAFSPELDWGSVLKDQKYFQFQSAYFSRMRRKLGDPKTQPEKFAALSALQHADAVRSAVLIFTGEFDLEISQAQAGDFAAAVRHNGFPAEVASFRNESDGLWHLDHKVEAYTRIEAFLAKNLAP